LFRSMVRLMNVELELHSACIIALNKKTWLLECMNMRNAGGGIRTHEPLEDEVSQSNQ
jgi:hypothetical protein